MLEALLERVGNGSDDLDGALEAPAAQPWTVTGEREAMFPEAPAGNEPITKHGAAGWACGQKVSGEKLPGYSGRACVTASR